MSDRFLSTPDKIRRTYGFVKRLESSLVPKVTQEHLDARRAEILDGARRAFAEHGYEGATVVKLEEATGLSRGAIFHYFENKNDLFVELAMEMNTRFGDILLESGLHGAFRAMAAESPEWLAVLIETESRMRHDEDFVRRFDAKAADTSPRIRDWFAEQQAAGNLRDDVSSVEISRFTTSLLNGLALRVAGGDPFDVEAMLQLLDTAIAAPRNPTKVRRPRPVAQKGR
jgi:TetR/AcrR family transcriptional regulator, transcriptional repressor of aconitase